MNKTGQVAEFARGSHGGEDLHRLSLSPPPGALAAAGWVLLPLRAFLGVTFCFAGLQKLANPNFFDASSPSSIQAQLIAANRSSPLHPILGHLLHLATPIGVVIALAELAVGLGTLLGLWARAAAAGGALLSLTLFLTVSYHSSPYYTGADIVFFFAWMPMILAGSGGVLSLDALIADRAGQAARLDGAKPESEPALRALDRRGAEPLARRRVVLGAMATAITAVGGLALAGVAAGLGRAIGGAKTSADKTAALPGAGATTTAPPASTAPPAGGSTSPPTTRPPGTPIGPARDVPVGGSATFTDPANGNPAIVIQRTAGDFAAFDAVCPHAGCTVGYSPGAGLIVCPCHGSEFNPQTGAVIQGPAPRGLTPIQTAVGPNNELYAR